jgi:uncharacterized coiled-coil DUF342 family protein
MKNAALMISGGIVFLLALVGAALLIYPTEPAPQPAIVVPVNPTITALEQQLVKQEATYQAQADALDRALAAQEADFAGQIAELTGQVQQARQQLNTLKAQEQTLLAQVAQLEAARAQKLAAYQAQIDQIRQDLRQDQVERDAQLKQLQTELTDVNARLGR